MNNFFDDINLSTDKTEEQFFGQLVERALNGKQSNFEFIRSWAERYSVKEYQFGVAAVIRVFQELCNATYRSYVTQIKTGTQDIQILLVLKQFRQCLGFYLKEYQIVKDMLEEYSEYLWCWHFLDPLLGTYRREEDLWDHRGKKPDGK